MNYNDWKTNPDLGAEREARRERREQEREREDEIAEREQSR